MMSFDDPAEVKDRLLQIASGYISKGPGYAQEGVVLREARSALKPQTLKEEQLILESWHRLFIDGELGWGFDLDNPGSPFFHATSGQLVTAVGAK